MKTSHLLNEAPCQWHEGDLYVIGVDFGGEETAWIPAPVMELIREILPPESEVGGFRIFIIDRIEGKEDSCYMASDVVMFAGGAGLAYLEPPPSVH